MPGNHPKMDEIVNRRVQGGTDSLTRKKRKRKLRRTKPVKKQAYDQQEY